MEKLKRVLIEKTRPGMIVGEPVTSGGAILVDKGTVLSEELIKRLRKRTGFVKIIDSDHQSHKPEIQATEVSSGTDTREDREIAMHIARLDDVLRTPRDKAKLKAASKAVDYLGDHVQKQKVCTALLRSMVIPDDDIKIKILEAVGKAEDKELCQVLPAMIMAIRMYSQPVKLVAVSVIESRGNESILNQLVPAMTSMHHIVLERILIFLKKLSADTVLKHAEKLFESGERIDATMAVNIMALFKSPEEIERIKIERLGLFKHDNPLEKKVDTKKASEFFAGEAAPVPEIMDPEDLVKYEPEESSFKVSEDLKLQIDKNELKNVSEENRLKAYSGSYQENIEVIAAFLKDIREGQNINEYGLTKVASSIVAQVKEDPAVAMRMTFTSTRNNYLLSHSLNVAYISLILAGLAGLTDEELFELAVAALVHDAGMAKIPADIWNAPRKLDLNEYFTVQKHTIYGLDALSEISKLSRTVTFVAYQHHEKVDGSGYPKCRTMHLISDYARIVALADVYDALTSPRPYRPAYEVQKALEIIDTKYSRELEPTFIGLLKQFLNGLDYIFK